MDNLLEKYLKEELTEEQFNAEVAKLSPEDKGKFDAELAKPEVQAKLIAKGQEALDKVTGLRKEKKRLEDQVPPAPSQNDYAETMRKENVATAENKFFTEYEIPEGERQHYRDLFKSNDSGHVAVEKILGDFTKIYAAEHSSELLDIQKRYKGLETGADDFNGQGAGGHGSGGGGGGEGEKFSPEVHEWVRQSEKKGIKISPADAKKVLDRGMTRIIG